MMQTYCLQERFAPQSKCFGCGPANALGLRVRSMVREGSDVVEAQWRAQKHHEAFAGMLNGGIIGSLLDCHCNWTAAWALMTQAQLSQPPCTVTAVYEIKLLRPTPSDAEIFLCAKVRELGARRAVVEGTLTAQHEVCATCTGTFVSVKEGHPAFGRW